MKTKSNCTSLSTDIAGSKTPAVRLKRILVTTDFSDASRQALPLAVELAGQFGATLTLVHVAPSPLAAEYSDSAIVLEEKRQGREAAERLARLREKELALSPTVETVLLQGRPELEVTRLAQESQADLILTATHGYTGLKHVWLGSIAERIVRYAHCPVLVVREKPVPMRFPGEALCRFQRILVPSDLSEASRQASRYATAFAQPCGSAVTLLHVIEPPPYPEFGYAHIPLKEAGLKQAALAQLETHAQALARAGVNVSSAIRHGSAHHEIAAEAREHNTDLIIIATHGRGAIAHALLGSTAERVVRHAPCPVLVVRKGQQGFLTLRR